MFVSSISYIGDSYSDNEIGLKVYTVNATTAISSIRHYYYGSTKKYTYLYLTTTGIKFVKESNAGDTYSDVTATFYYRELK